MEVVATNVISTLLDITTKIIKQLVNKDGVIRKLTSKTVRKIVGEIVHVLKKICGEDEVLMKLRDKHIKRMVNDPALKRVVALSEFGDIKEQEFKKAIKVSFQNVYNGQMPEKEKLKNEILEELRSSLQGVYPSLPK